MNQSSTLPLNREVIHIPSYKVGLQHVYGNFVSVLCPADEGKRKMEDEIYITFIWSILSISSLLFLVVVYMSFKELRNLPGKCLVSLSIALVWYQIIFCLSAVSKDVEGLWKAVAICLHFFFPGSFFHGWVSSRLTLQTLLKFKVSQATIRSFLFPVFLLLVLHSSYGPANHPFSSIHLSFHPPEDYSSRKRYPWNYGMSWNSPYYWQFDRRTRLVMLYIW